MTSKNLAQNPKYASIYLIELSRSAEIEIPSSECIQSQTSDSCCCCRGYTWFIKPGQSVKLYIFKNNFGPVRTYWSVHVYRPVACGGPGGAGPPPCVLPGPPAFLYNGLSSTLGPPMDRAGPCCKIVTLRGCMSMRYVIDQNGNWRIENNLPALLYLL